MIRLTKYIQFICAIICFIVFNSNDYKIPVGQCIKVEWSSVIVESSSVHGQYVVGQSVEEVGQSVVVVSPINPVLSTIQS